MYDHLARHKCCFYNYNYDYFIFAFVGVMEITQEFLLNCFSIEKYIRNIVYQLLYIKTLPWTLYFYNIG